VALLLRLALATSGVGWPRQRAGSFTAKSQDTLR
jgi:hypothetical protein